MYVFIFIHFRPTQIAQLKSEVDSLRSRATEAAEASGMAGKAREAEVAALRRSLKEMAEAAAALKKDYAGFKSGAVDIVEEQKNWVCHCSNIGQYHFAIFPPFLRSSQSSRLHKSLLWRTPSGA